MNKERGSVTLYAVIIIIAALALTGLVVDGGAQMRTQQRADQVAREAARAAGQAINGQPVLGRPGLVDVSRGRQAAQKYLATAGIAGTVTVNGTTISITTNVPYEPIMLSAFGMGTVTVSGYSEATTKQVYLGEEQ